MSKQQDAFTKMILEKMKNPEFKSAYEAELNKISQDPKRCKHASSIGEFDLKNKKEYLRCMDCGYEWEEALGLAKEGDKP